MNAYRSEGLPHAQILKKYVSFIKKVQDTLGCFASEREVIPAAVQTLVDERKAARDRKDFQESDRLRDAIKERGFAVKDTSEGQVVRKAL